MGDGKVARWQGKGRDTGIRLDGYMSVDGRPSGDLMIMHSPTMIDSPDLNNSNYGMKVEAIVHGT